MVVDGPNRPLVPEEPDLDQIFEAYGFLPDAPEVYECWFNSMPSYAPK